MHLKFPGIIKNLPETDIPDQVVHSATFKKKTRAIDFYVDKDEV